MFAKFCKKRSKFGAFPRGVALSHTRRFSNHESRLLSQSHTFAIIVILDLTPYLLRWYVRIYPKIIMSKSHENTLLTNFSQKVNNPERPLDDLWPNTCWCPTSDSTQWSCMGEMEQEVKIVPLVRLWNWCRECVRNPHFTVLKWRLCPPLCHWSPKRPLLCSKMMPIS